jgi:hypothetical protein
MATFVSVLYHRWSSKCFQVMASAEGILATIGMAMAAPVADLERLQAEIRELIAESGRIDDRIDAGELRRIARDALGAAERVREVIERTPLAPNHPLRQLYDQLSDCAELLGLSVDPALARDVERAQAEARRGESISWDRLREDAG